MAFLNKFPEQLHPTKFLSLLNSLSKPLPSGLPNPNFANLLENYKTYHSEYSRDSNLFSALIFHMTKLKLTDSDLWAKIEANLPMKLNELPSSRLVALATVLKQRNSAALLLIENALETKVNDMPAALQARICKDLPKSRILSLVARKKLPIENEIDLEHYTGAFLKRKNEFPHISTELEVKFLQIVPTVSSLRGVCNILNNFNEAECPVGAGLIWAIETKATSPGIRLSLKDIHHLLKAFNHRLIYGRVSQGFWPAFGEKILSRIDDFPPGLLMKYLSETMFFVKPVFDALVPRWQKRTETGQIDEFKEGLLGLLASPLLEDSVLRWAATQCMSHISSFRAYGLVSILRGLMLISYYDKPLWEAFLSAPQFSSATNLDKLTLHHALKGLEIDDPPMAKELLQKHSLLYAETKSAFRTMNMPNLVSNTEDRLIQVLAELGIESTRSTRLEEMYSADFYIEKLKTDVEFLGWPYHISQVDGSIDARTVVKARHLQKRGYSLILVSTFENLVPRLSKAFQQISASPKPLLFVLRSSFVRDRYDGLVMREVREDNLD